MEERSRLEYIEICVKAAMVPPLFHINSKVDNRYGKVGQMVWLTNSMHREIIQLTNVMGKVDNWYGRQMVWLTNGMGKVDNCMVDKWYG